MKKEIKQKESKIVKYITTKVDIELATEYIVSTDTVAVGAEVSKTLTVNLKATFNPEQKKIRLTNLDMLTTTDISTAQLRAIAKSFTDLADVCEAKDRLRELAEGFGDSIEEHKAKKNGNKRA